MNGYDGNPFHHALIMRAETAVDRSNWPIVIYASSKWPRPTWLVPADGGRFRQWHSSSWTNLILPWNQPASRPNTAARASPAKGVGVMT